MKDFELLLRRLAQTSPSHLTSLPRQNLSFSVFLFGEHWRNVTRYNFVDPHLRNTLPGNRSFKFCFKIQGNFCLFYICVSCPLFDNPQFFLQRQHNSLFSPSHFFMSFFVILNWRLFLYLRNGNSNLY